MSGMRQAILAAALLMAAPVAAECRIEARASLPLIFDGFMPTVEAVIDGETVRLGIDTGSQGSILTPAAVERLHLTRDRNRFTTAIGGTGRLLVSNALVAELRLGGERWQDLSLAVIAISQPGANNPPMAGIVGADLLSRYDLDLDLPGQSLTLNQVTGCISVSPAWRDAATRSAPITLTRSRRPLLPVELDGRGVTALFDSGSGATLRSPAATAGGPEPGTLFIVDENASLSPRRLGQLRIGGEQLPPMRLGQLDFPLGEADLLIGADYMRSRRFWLSYATGRLFIQPPSQAQMHPAEH